MRAATIRVRKLHEERKIRNSFGEDNTAEDGEHGSPSESRRVSAASMESFGTNGHGNRGDQAVATQPSGQRSEILTEPNMLANNGYLMSAVKGMDDVIIGRCVCSQTEMCQSAQ